MEAFPMPLNEIAAREFTHVFKLTWDDDLDVAATTTTVQLISVAAGDQVVEAAYYLETQFSTPGDRTGLDVNVGDGSDVDRIINSSLTLASQVVYYAENPPLRHVYTAADTVDAHFLLTGGTTGNLEDLTAGLLWIGLKIVELSDLKQDSRG